MNGPDPESLKRLHESLPGFVKQIENKRVLRGQLPIGKTQPSKVCKICGRGFDRKIIKGSPFPELATCPKCAKLLKQGYQAIVSDNRYAFVKSTELKKGGEEIIECSPIVFDKLQDCFSLEWENKEPPPANETPPEPNSPTSN